VFSLETITVSGLSLTYIFLTSLGTCDVIDIVTLCDDLTAC
jgi:hypothetical protein